MTEPLTPTTPIARDARLDAALQHMPDAQMEASAATRLAVLRAAQAAVQPDVNVGSGQSWWHKLFGARQNRMPWNAGFATVLIAGFVTLLFQHRDEMDLPPERPAAAASPATSTPAPSASTAEAVADAATANTTPSANPPTRSAPEAKLKKAQPAPQSPTPSPVAPQTTESPAAMAVAPTPAPAPTPAAKEDRVASSSASVSRAPAKALREESATPAAPMMAAPRAPQPASASAAAPEVASLAPPPAPAQAPTSAPVPSIGADALANTLGQQRSKSAAVASTAPAAVVVSITVNGVQRSVSVAQVAALQALLDKLVYSTAAETPETAAIYQLRIRHMDYRIYTDAVQRHSGANAVQSSAVSNLSAAQFAQIQALMAAMVQN